jgi:hypothetical protein
MRGEVEFASRLSSIGVPAGVEAMTRFCGLAAVALGLCLSRCAFGGEAAPTIPPATPQQVHQTVDRAIAYLQTESGTWLSQRKCAACHHAGMPLWALAEAGRQGYAIDRKFMADTVEATLGGPEKLIASKLVSGPNDPPDTRPMARGVNMGLPFLAVAALSMPSLEPGQKQSLRRIADEIVRKQQADGSWEFFLSRPPVNESQATDVAWIIMALESVTGRDAELNRAAMEKGMAWLAGAEPDNEQAKTLKLLVALRADKPREAMRAQFDELLARHRPDGGWGQTAELPSDAFATGEALYVLALAGYSAERSSEVRRGIDFLVATQKTDGSWPMTSRASPDGKPGGSAKLLSPITCAASSWATLALARLAPKGP